MNILFIMPVHIGDAVMASGILNAILEKYASKKPNLWLCIGRSALDLFYDAPVHIHIIGVRSYPQRSQCNAVTYALKKIMAGFWKKVAILKLVWKTRKVVWDLIIDLSLTPCFLLRFFKCKELKDTQAAEKRLGHPISSETHNTLRAAYIAGIDHLCGPKLWLNTKLDQETDTLLRDSLPILAICPTASLPRKEWPIEYFAQLVSKLIAPDGIMAGYSVFITGSLDDRKRCQPLIDALPPHLVIDGFGMSVGMASTIIKRARLFLGNDSAFMHIAAALGVLTLGLFGPTSVLRYRPLGARAHTLSCDDIPKASEESPSVSRDLMRKIAPSFVLQAIVNIMRADAKIIPFRAAAKQ